VLTYANGDVFTGDWFQGAITDGTYQHASEQAEWHEEAEQQGEREEEEKRRQRAMIAEDGERAFEKHRAAALKVPEVISLCQYAEVRKEREGIEKKREW
jgi:hypothetical protein